MSLESFVLNEVLHRIPRAILSVIGDASGLQQHIAEQVKLVVDKFPVDVPPRCWSSIAHYVEYQIKTTIFTAYENHDERIKHLSGEYRQLVGEYRDAAFLGRDVMARIDKIIEMITPRGEPGLLEA